jgi:hypothetical protein
VKNGMNRYKNISGISGVTHYSIGRDFIKVKFKESPGIYIYDYSLNGAVHIEEMKKAAVKGLGLSTYIAQHPEVKNRYRMH